jgi:hypothetical protein
MKPNYLAVVVAAIAYWLLGAVWYGKLFAAAWISLEHVTPEQMQGPQPVWPYIVTLLLNIVIAFFLAQLCAWRNANTAARGAALGILIWIAFVGPITYTTYMYEMRAFQLFAINQFYPLVGLALMGAIVGAWKKKAA